MKMRSTKRTYLLIFLMCCSSIVITLYDSQSIEPNDSSYQNEAALTTEEPVFKSGSTSNITTMVEATTDKLQIEDGGTITFFVAVYFQNTSLTDTRVTLGQFQITDMNTNRSSHYPVYTEDPCETINWTVSTNTDGSSGIHSFNISYLGYLDAQEGLYFNRSHKTINLILFEMWDGDGDCTYSEMDVTFNYTHVHRNIDYLSGLNISTSIQRYYRYQSYYIVFDKATNLVLGSKIWPAEVNNAIIAFFDYQEILMRFPSFIDTGTKDIRFYYSGGNVVDQQPCYYDVEVRVEDINLMVSLTNTSLERSHATEQHVSTLTTTAQGLYNGEYQVIEYITPSNTRIPVYNGTAVDLHTYNASFDDDSPLGMYIFRSYYALDSSTWLFSEDVTCLLYDQVEITCTTNTTTLSPLDTLNIYGRITAEDQTTQRVKGTVEIVLDSSISLASIEVNAQGYFNYNWEINETLSGGEHQLGIRFTPSSPDYAAKTELTIKELLVLRDVQLYTVYSKNITRGNQLDLTIYLRDSLTNETITDGKFDLFDANYELVASVDIISEINYLTHILPLEYPLGPQYYRLEFKNSSTHNDNVFLLEVCVFGTLDFTNTYTNMSNTGSAILFNGTLVDETSQPLPNITIDVFDFDEYLTTITTNHHGIFSLIYTKNASYSSQNHNFIFQAPANPKVYYHQKYIEFRSIRYNLSNPALVKRGTLIEIDISLYDENNTRITEGVLQLYNITQHVVDGINLSDSTTNRLVYIIPKGYPLGPCSFKISFKNNSQYHDDFFYVTIDIYDSLQLNASYKDTLALGDVLYCDGTVLDSSYNPVSNITVQVLIKGESIGYFLTNDKGQFSFSYQVDSHEQLNQLFITAITQPAPYYEETNQTWVVDVDTLDLITLMYDYYMFKNESKVVYLNVSFDQEIATSVVAILNGTNVEMTWNESVNHWVASTFITDEGSYEIDILVDNEIRFDNTTTIVVHFPTITNFNYTYVYYQTEEIIGYNFSITFSKGTNDVKLIIEGQPYTMYSEDLLEWHVDLQTPETEFIVLVKTLQAEYIVGTVNISIQPTTTIKNGTYQVVESTYEYVTLQLTVEVEYYYNGSLISHILNTDHLMQSLDDNMTWSTLVRFYESGKYQWFVSNNKVNVSVGSISVQILPFPVMKSYQVDYLNRTLNFIKVRFNCSLDYYSFGEVYLNIASLTYTMSRMGDFWIQDIVLLDSGTYNWTLYNENILLGSDNSTFTYLIPTINDSGLNMRVTAFEYPTGSIEAYINLEYWLELDNYTTGDLTLVVNSTAFPITYNTTTNHGSVHIVYNSTNRMFITLEVVLKNNEYVIVTEIHDVNISNSCIEITEIVCSIVEATYDNATLVTQLRTKNFTGQLYYVTYDNESNAILCEMIFNQTEAMWQYSDLVHSSGTYAIEVVFIQNGYSFRTCVDHVEIDLPEEITIQVTNYAAQPVFHNGNSTYTFIVDLYNTTNIELTSRINSTSYPMQYNDTATIYYFQVSFYHNQTILWDILSNGSVYNSTTISILVFKQEPIEEQIVVVTDFFTNATHTDGNATYRFNLQVKNTTDCNITCKIDTITYDLNYDRSTDFYYFEETYFNNQSVFVEIQINGRVYNATWVHITVYVEPTLVEWIHITNYYTIPHYYDNGTSVYNFIILVDNTSNFNVVSRLDGKNLIMEYNSTSKSYYASQQFNTNTSILWEILVNEQVYNESIVDITVYYKSTKESKVEIADFYVEHVTGGNHTTYSFYIKTANSTTLTVVSIIDTKNISMQYSARHDAYMCNVTFYENTTLLWKIAISESIYNISWIEIVVYEVYEENVPIKPVENVTILEFYVTTVYLDGMSNYSFFIQLQNTTTANISCKIDDLTYNLSYDNVTQLYSCTELFYVNRTVIWEIIVDQHVYNSTIVDIVVINKSHSQPETSTAPNDGQTSSTRSTGSSSTRSSSSSPSTSSDAVINTILAVSSVAVAIVGVLIRYKFRT